MALSGQRQMETQCLSCWDMLVLMHTMMDMCILCGNIFLYLGWNVTYFLTSQKCETYSSAYSSNCPGEYQRIKVSWESSYISEIYKTSSVWRSKLASFAENSPSSCKLGNNSNTAFNEIIQTQHLMDCLQSIYIFNCVYRIFPVCLSSYFHNKWPNSTILK